MGESTEMLRSQSLTPRIDRERLQRSIGELGAIGATPRGGLTRLALRNPVLILMLSLMMIVLGGVSVSRLSVDLFPDITIPMIRVAP